VAEDSGNQKSMYSKTATTITIIVCTMIDDMRKQLFFLTLIQPFFDSILHGMLVGPGTFPAAL
jgi:hypothetical protein